MLLSFSFFIVLAKTLELEPLTLEHRKMFIATIVSEFWIQEIQDILCLSYYLT